LIIFTILHIDRLFAIDFATLNLVRSFFNSIYVVIFLTACKPDP
jgi:hypothetical protein